MRATAIVIATLMSASAAVIAVDSGGGIDPRKSLAITDHAILSRFAFSRVMKQLVAQSGVPGRPSSPCFSSGGIVRIRRRDTAPARTGTAMMRVCSIR